MCTAQPLHGMECNPGVSEAHHTFGPETRVTRIAAVPTLLVGLVSSWPYGAHSSAGAIQWPLSREQSHHRASLAPETPAELLCSPFKRHTRPLLSQGVTATQDLYDLWVTSKICTGGGDLDGNKQVITRLGITVIQTHHFTALPTTESHVSFFIRSAPHKVWSPCLPRLQHLAPGPGNGEDKPTLLRKCFSVLAPVPASALVLAVLHFVLRLRFP